MRRPVERARPCGRRPCALPASSPMACSFASIAAVTDMTPDLPVENPETRSGFGNVTTCRRSSRTRSPSRRWEHLLLGLRDPSVRVAWSLSSRVEPALLSYYLELAGVGPWGRLAVFDPSDVAGLRAFVGDDDGGRRRRASTPIASRWGSPGASTRPRGHPADRRVQVLAAFDREPCRHPASGDVGPLFRAAARVGAALAGAGAVGRFAVELDADGSSSGSTRGVGPRAGDDARAAGERGALRVGRRVSGVGRRRAALLWHRPGTRWPGRASWRSRLLTGVELVALGGARFEAEERFSAAVAPCRPRSRRRLTGAALVSSRSVAAGPALRASRRT